MAGPTHFFPVEHRSTGRGDTGRLPHLVMAARVAAIHVFGAVSKSVDGRDAPGHDGERSAVTGQNSITLV
jgi:hypothetical protein